ncbi:hypothetical protein NDU88_004218 [Pleurodeles waltl]|uniref:Uncharacterized protein n=1 Tax=Pleurodeles waltl TaxID=8319 RepID=A0AAV7L1A1_PLEWA|nr:hypothetical protein NDU88_004218 [Pleurodeles waltl]
MLRATGATNGLRRTRLSLKARVLGAAASAGQASTLYRCTHLGLDIRSCRRSGPFPASRITEETGGVVTGFSLSPSAYEFPVTRDPGERRLCSRAAGSSCH